MFHPKTWLIINQNGNNDSNLHKVTNQMTNQAKRKKHTKPTNQQNKKKQDNTNQNNTKKNNTKQHKTKQNRTKQNKTE